MNINATSIYAPLTCAPYTSPVAIAVPIATAESRFGARWAREANAACADEASIRAAIRGDAVPSGTTYCAALATADLGRLDMTVTHRPSHIAIRLHCASDASYAWLTSKRPLLECRLTRALGRTAQVEVTQGPMS